MDDALDRKKSVLIGRAILGYSALILYLFLPTMWLKKAFVLGIARLPLWKEFEFFAAMYEIIENGKKRTHHDCAD